MGLVKEDLQKKLDYLGVWLSKILNGKKCGKKAESKLDNAIFYFKRTLKEKMLLVDYVTKLINSDIVWEKIRDIRIVKNPPKYVYDLRSNINPNYVANGFVIHNCGRMNKSSLGVGTCLGNKKIKEEANNLLLEYKKELIEALDWFYKSRRSTNIIERNKFVIINAGDMIRDTLIGTLASIISKSNLYQEGTIILSMAYTLTGDIKVSTRFVDKSDLDLSAVIKKIVSKVGGLAGGHVSAAGAIIPQDKEEEFIKEAVEILTNEIVIK